jgi:hypothetical protein
VWSGAVEFGGPTGPLDVSLKSLTASSVSSVVLRGMLKGRRSVIRRRKKSQFVRQLLKRGGVFGGRACVVSSSMTESDRMIGRSRTLLQRSLGEYPL